MPYRCRDRRRFVSIKTNVPMQRSKRAIGLYLNSTSVKGMSSVKLHRDLDIAQKSAWHMAQCFRKMYDFMHAPFRGPVKVNATYMGCKEDNKHECKKLNAGRGAVGMGDRATGQVSAEVLESTDARTLTNFVHERTIHETMVFTNEAPAYSRLKRPLLWVVHGVKEFVNGMIHKNGMESVWAALKRGYIGTHHHVSFKHLPRYVNEFTGPLNLRVLDTEDLMGTPVPSGVGRRLQIVDLIGPNHTRRPALIRDWS